MSTGEPNVIEAYAFACLNCGHGWEQSYEIEHHTDTHGHPFVRYLVDGRKVPSPLTRPTCQNCDGHLVRIMRAGQVSGIARRAGHRGERPAARRPWHRSVLAFLHLGQGGAETA
ncbi:hypothetical protein ACFO3J_20025 [Streptomyces polygonati]|uniref:C2H2-type domain-containing protein n=1 Tax=Streptomyces polygonati TaxID=1617087 RepID=A0ABV8HTV7_9ACTN